MVQDADTDEQDVDSDQRAGTFNEVRAIERLAHRLNWRCTRWRRSPRRTSRRDIDLVLPRFAPNVTSRTTETARYQDLVTSRSSCAFVVGDTAIEPVTSSVSATVHYIVDLHRSEAPQDTAFSSGMFTALRGRRARFRAVTCSQSA